MQNGAWDRAESTLLLWDAAGTWDMGHGTWGMGLCPTLIPVLACTDSLGQGLCDGLLELRLRAFVSQRFRRLRGAGRLSMLGVRLPLSPVDGTLIMLSSTLPRSGESTSYYMLLTTYYLLLTTHHLLT